MKKICASGLILMFVVFALFPFTTVAAENLYSNTCNISILSPSQVKGYPGKEELIKVEIKNNSDKTLNNLLVYITMADVKKNMTVNLEDFSADTPVTISALKPRQTKIVELPIRFVYTSTYNLYTTVVSKEDNKVVSSDSIPIEIMGNTKVDKNMVMVVSYGEPALLILGTFIIMFKKHKKFV